jgi:hypothetical protein
MMPLMLQAFGWTWVLADGLFFVGMLTSQSSVTNETVSRVFFSILAARLYQLAGAYLAYKAFVKEPGPKVVATYILVYTAGAICAGLTASEFMSTTDFSRVASLPTQSFASYHIVQWFFVFLVVVLPETWRIINVANAVWGLTTDSEKREYEIQKLLISAEALFTWEWVVRLVLAMVTIIPLATAARDKNQALLAFMYSA